jgi:hypothetical protein
MVSLKLWNLMSFWRVAPGSAQVVNITMNVSWLTPTGFGATWILTYVAIVHGGVCAFAAGKATSEIAIANNRNIATAVALDFFLQNCNFLLSPIFYRA